MSCVSTPRTVRGAGTQLIATVIIGDLDHIVVIQITDDYSSDKILSKNIFYMIAIGPQSLYSA